MRHTPPMITKQPNRFGWRPDSPDHRDLVLKSSRFVIKALPPSADLRADMPEIWDQGNLGSCVANAVGSLYQHADMAEGTDPWFMPSRLYLYYNARALDHTVPYDAGTTIRNGIKSIVRCGLCPEEIWPYDIAKFSKRPSSAAYKAAVEAKIMKYGRVLQNEAQIKAQIADGSPVAFGFSVFNNFDLIGPENNWTVPMPDDSGIQGGHAVVAVAYDDAARLFTIRNSWGNAWGLGGYFYMTYDFLLNQDICSDFWVIKWAP